ncbi:MAG: helix-turn-helix domain-containing protein [Clostridia bacterium]|nr:helix-turn-helix domain-containing protein [Clostridia bacterium]
MIEDIIKYIDYLKNEHGLMITVHGINERLSSAGGELAPYNIHGNPYCLYIKSCRENWDECIARQVKVMEKCASGAFFGSCYGGVGEFVIPIKNADELIGFISVSGYRGDPRKRDYFARKYGFPPEKLKEIYEKNLSAERPSIERVKLLTAPLAAMLTLLYLQQPGKSEDTGGDYVYGHILTILHSDFSERITIGSIARSCHCSESYVSHLFKKKTGTTVGKYLTKIRLEEAKKLLSSTDISVSEIAYSTGFCDSNYFIYVFGKNVGMTPTYYRKANK